MKPVKIYNCSCCNKHHYITVHEFKVKRKVGLKFWATCMNTGDPILFLSNEKLDKMPKYVQKVLKKFSRVPDIKYGWDEIIEHDEELKCDTLAFPTVDLWGLEA